eukprot:358342-Chlamydomonas_euryale.AAC.2
MRRRGRGVPSAKKPYLTRWQRCTSAVHACAGEHRVGRTREEINKYGLEHEGENDGEDEAEDEAEDSLGFLGFLGFIGLHEGKHE